MNEELNVLVVRKMTLMLSFALREPFLAWASKSSRILGCNKWTQATGSGYLCVMLGPFCYYWLSPYTLKLTSGENPILTTSMLATLLSITEIGEAIGSVPSAIFSDRFGRKTSLLLAGPLIISSYLISLLTKNIVVLLVIRILQGYVAATVEVVAPVYLAEISGAKIRGTVCGYYSVFWNLGIVVVFFVSEYLSFDMYTLSLTVVPILFCGTFIFMPESPYYCLMKGETDEARSSLQWLRHGEDIKKEYEQIEEAVREDLKNTGSWIDLIATKEDRRALYIVLIGCMARYLIGISTFIAYAEDIFAKAGQNDLFTPNHLAIFYALLFTICSAVASFFSDTIGRRKLLIYSLIGTVISNVIVALYFCLLELTSLQITSHIWIMYLGSTVCCIFTNTGIGQLVPTIKAEFLPSHTRNRASALTNAIASLAIFVQLFLFPMIATYIGMYFNFVTFAAVALFCTFLVFNYIPEYPDKALDEDEDCSRCN